jgi:hypothetical protein
VLNLYSEGLAQKIDKTKVVAYAVLSQETIVCSDYALIDAYYAVERYSVPYRKFKEALERPGIYNNNYFWQEAIGLIFSRKDAFISVYVFNIGLAVFRITFPALTRGADGLQEYVYEFFHTAHFDKELGRWTGLTSASNDLTHVVIDKVWTQTLGTSRPCKIYKAKLGAEGYVRVAPIS